MDQDTPEKKQLQGLIDLGLIGTEPNPDGGEMLHTTADGVEWAEVLLEKARPEMCEDCARTIWDGVDTLRAIGDDERIDPVTNALIQVAVNSSKFALRALMGHEAYEPFLLRMVAKRYAEDAARRQSPN